MERFRGRVALVTGAGHGIGAATVRRLAAEGASVVLAELDTAAAETVAAELAPDRCRVVACDVTDRAQVDAAVAAAEDRFGRLDLLVSVAGGSHGGASIPDGATDESWQRSLDLNLVGPMRCIRAASPLLQRNGGAIVLIGSVNGLAAFGDEAYSASKAGLGIIAKNLARELGPDRVRVNVVAPGTVRTRVWDDQGGPDRFARLYPLGRVGEPDDIAAAVAFLGSDDAAWITGITLPVDGGITAGAVPPSWAGDQA